MAELKVFTGGGKSVHEASGELAKRITSMIYEYSGSLPLSAAIGVLEIVKIELMKAHE